MSIASIQAAAQWVGKLALKEVRYLKKVRGNVEELKGELEWMQCFLLDADMKQNNDALIRKWISEICDLSLEAEDIIETFILKVSDQKATESVILDYLLLWLTRCGKDPLAVRKVGSQIDNVTSKMSKLTSRLQQYGVRGPYDVGSSHIRTLLAEQRRTYAHDSAPFVVGIEDHVTGLITQLLQAPEKKIVVVHGMGGIGKTTLARQVYGDPRAKKGFVGFAWAYVSQQVHFETICRDILYQLIPDDRNTVQNFSNSELPGRLCAVLTTKKFLVVLDDVWTDADWQSLAPAFPIRDSSFKSKLLITTRNPQILLNLGDGMVSTFEASTLNDENGWKLLQYWGNFKEKSLPVAPLGRNPGSPTDLRSAIDPGSPTDLRSAIDPGSATDLRSATGTVPPPGRNPGSATGESLGDCLYVDPEMKEVAWKMLKHCDGNPLAIVALGGVLASKKSLREWESVLDDLLSHLQGDGLYSRVYDVLAMGYYDLHYNIKPCFLHMGHFPEDFQISVERIYNLWIADGIVSPIQDRIGSKKSLEEIADSYLNQLVQKGMVRVVDNDAYDKINTCSLHDLIRDKCLEITREENFVEIVDLENRDPAGTADADSKKVRRLTLHVGRAPPKVVFDMNALTGDVSSLRSLLFISICGEEDGNEVTSEEDGNEVTNEEDGNAVTNEEDGNAVTSEKAGNEVSSKWIKVVCRKFLLLRVLDFEGVVLGGILPTEVGNLIYLRYLSLKGTHVTELLTSISNLRCLLILDLRVKKVRIKLPNVFWKLTSLRHLYFPTRLMSQEKVEFLVQGYDILDGNILSNLDKLSHLERVDNVDLDRVDANSLRKLSSTRKLSATCKSLDKGWDGLASVLESSNIKYLSLKVDAGLLFGTSSMVLSQSESLRTLHIDRSRAEPLALPIRAEMFPRNLVELGFWYCEIEEDPMFLLQELKNLKILQFRICYNGQKMKCSSTGFPKVTYLLLDGLGELNDWSVDRGGFPMLQKIGIYNCPLQAFPVTLPSNILFSCTPDLDEKVKEFRESVSVSEAHAGSSTGGQQINVVSTTLE